MMSKYKPNAKKEMVSASFYIEKEAHTNMIVLLSKDWGVSQNEVVRCILDLGFRELERLEENTIEHEG